MEMFRFNPLKYVVFHIKVNRSGYTVFILIVRIRVLNQFDFSSGSTRNKATVCLKKSISITAWNFKYSRERFVFKRLINPLIQITQILMNLMTFLTKGKILSLEKKREKTIMKPTISAIIKDTLRTNITLMKHSICDSFQFLS